MSPKIDRTASQRVLLAAICYFACAAYFSGDSHRHLNSEGRKNLEFVRSTHTGGAIIEKAAAKQGILWGACHFIKVKEEGCKSPDYRWFSLPPKPNFIFTNVWQTPPKYLKTSIADNQNPYTNKDLFTVVRNPYARYVSEFYCPYDGYQEGGENAEILNTWIQNYITQTTEEMKTYKEHVANGEAMAEIEAPPLVATKHFLPQVEYVYDVDGSRIVKNVLRFEDLRSEFKNLMSAYGHKVHLPHNIHESKGALSYKDLTPKTIQMINEYARADFYAFGYEMVKSFKENPKYSIRAKTRPCRVFNAADPASETCEADENNTVQKTKRKESSRDVPIGRPHATVMLIGVFTDYSETQAEARQRIRDTYLHTESWPLICTLEEYQRQFDLSNGLWVPCRLPYVFIMGGDPNRPDKHYDSLPITVERSLVGNAPVEEDDIVYLNIADSKGTGKSQAFFKWAAAFGSHYNIDFVGKLEPDTLMDRQRLVNFMDTELPPAPMNRRMYGGCSWGHRGTYFATKSFYFMSIDLAKRIGEVKIHPHHHEPRDIGEHIFYHSKPVKFVNMNPDQFWFTDIDTKEKWSDHWANRMSELPIANSNIYVYDICKELEAQGNLWHP